jgi:hypothetical protein
MVRLKITNRILFLLFLFFGIATNILAQERYVLPVDEGRKDASFVSFRQKLTEATKKRDRKFILGILDRNIKNSFGGSGGIKEFEETWNIKSPKSKFWNEMLIVIINGGVFFDESTFIAPFSTEKFPKDLDAFEHQVIFGSNVNLRSQPKSSSRLISQLSYNVVKVDYENSVKEKTEEDKYLWLKVETLGGKKGFVNAKYVRSSIEYRAIFEKNNGKWKMGAFISGD